MPYQDVRGISLYYEVTGSGPPLLLLHGLGSSTRDWQFQTEAFADRYRVVTLDLRGHGRSDKPPGPYSMPLLARDVARFMEAGGLESAHVVGMSMGGMVGLQLAADHPGRVRSLTIVNSVAAIPVRTWQQRLVWYGRRLLVQLLGMGAVGWVLAHRLFPHEGQDALRSEFARRWAENDRRAYLASIDAIAGWSVRARLPEIACPTLYLTADQDYTPVRLKRACAARMPDARVTVIPATRHALPVEHPEAFNAALGRFLEEAAGAPPSAVAAPASGPQP